MVFIAASATEDFAALATEGIAAFPPDVCFRLFRGSGSFAIVLYLFDQPR